MRSNCTIYLAIIIIASCCLPFHGSATKYTWTQLATMPAPPRHRVVALSIGNRGYIGLGHVNSNSSVIYGDWWEYNPGNNAWTQKADFGGGNRYHATGFVIGNYAYVGTGRAQTMNNTVDFWKYDPLANQWSQISDFPGTPRRGAVGFAIGDSAFVGSGSGTSDFYMYTPSNDTWTPISPIPTGGRIASVAFTIEKKGYVGTGSVGGWFSNDFWEYDPANDQWTSKAPVGTLQRSQAGGFALQGKGYIGTGISPYAENYGDFYEYDPQLNTWIQIKDFPGTKRRYLGCFTIGDKAYAGTGTNGTNFGDLWEFTADTTIGVRERSAGDYKLFVYPNPVQTKAVFKWDTPAASQGNVSYALYDLHGNAVFVAGEAAGSEFHFMRNGLPAGTYLLSASDSDGYSTAVKIILL